MMSTDVDRRDPATIRFRRFTAPDLVHIREVNDDPFVETVTSSLLITPSF